MDTDFFVNNKPANNIWGATLQHESLVELLKPNPAKPFVENTSRSIDGKQVLPKNPRVDSRDIALMISINGTSFSDYLVKVEAFFAEIAQGVISFKVPMLNKTYRLVYKDSTLRKVNNGTCFGIYRIEFNEPNPTDRAL
jgi:hypothetical protein